MQFADVAELADALDSGSSARKGVEVQVLSSALLFSGFLAIAGSPVFLWVTPGFLRVTPGFLRATQWVESRYNHRFEVLRLVSPQGALHVSVVE